VSCGIWNLATLTIESDHDFILAVSVIPRLATTWNSETTTALLSNNTSTTNYCEERPSNDNTITLTISFLNAHRLESASVFEYHLEVDASPWFQPRRNGLKRDDVVANRQTFCKRYLTDYEPYCKRWVQLSVEDAKTTMNLNMTFGYGYHNIISNKDHLYGIQSCDMIEFHMDYWSQHQQ
jgi:hypothetical protein